jgi:sugar phosphate isomerase/epimerase
MYQFGVSSHLFHEHRLSRDHLVHIAAHGFELVELFATQAHFDFKSREAIAEVAEWLSDTRLTLHSIHAPIVERMHKGRWVGAFSNASSDESRRKLAVAEAQAALAVAAQIPYRYLVLHLGVPANQQQNASDNQPGAARRSVEEIAEAAARVNVRIAVEVMPNALSGADAVARLVEEELEGLDVGVCLDYGHAHLMGDLGEAIEELSGHMWTTHVHDNHGKTDDHLPPFAGTIDWDAAMMETQKIGYDGALMFEVADTGDPVDVLERCAKARERLEKSFVTFEVEDPRA